MVKSLRVASECTTTAYKLEQLKTYIQEHFPLSLVFSITGGKMNGEYYGGISLFEKTEESTPIFDYLVDQPKNEAPKVSGPNKPLDFIEPSFFSVMVDRISTGSDDFVTLKLSEVDDVIQSLLQEAERGEDY